MWLWIESTEMPMSLVLRLSNSACRRANSASSVEHTGVKSAGWLNRSTQWPSCHFEKVSSPCVVIAVKSGATSPMRGIVPIVAGVCVVVSGMDDMVEISTVEVDPEPARRGGGPGTPLNEPPVHGCRKVYQKVRDSVKERETHEGGGWPGASRRAL